MEASKDEELRRAVSMLAGFIALTESRGLDDTARFLAMARMSLLMELNGVTDGELRALSLALEPAATAAERRTGSTRALSGATAENGSLRDMMAPRRAGLRPGSMAAARGRRAQMKT